MSLNDSNKILLDYIFSYTLAVIYKIKLKINSDNNCYVANISEQMQYNIEK